MLALVLRGPCGLAALIEYILQLDSIMRVIADSAHMRCSGSSKRLPGSRYSAIVAKSFFWDLLSITAAALQP